MNPITAEWVMKAEADFGVAMRELRGRKSPSYDASCFHAQQSAEKYLKAVLQESITPFTRTHDLLTLVALLPPDPFWALLTKQLHALAVHAVNSRYPGKFAGKTEASDAVQVCREVRGHCRHLLALPVLK